MSDPLLQSVLDDPDSDGPRLVYADWLDEQGDADRAEFIRTQIALARAPAHDPRRPDLLAREESLRERHRVEWLRPLLGAVGELDPDQWCRLTSDPEFDAFPNLGVSSLEFRRGFVEVAALNAGRDLTEGHLRGLVGLAPLRSVTLLANGSVPASIAGSACWNRLRELTTFAAGAGAAARAFAAAPHPCALETLNLVGLLTGADVGALAASPRLAGLTRLALCPVIPGRPTSDPLADLPAACGGLLRGPGLPRLDH